LEYHPGFNRFFLLIAELFLLSKKPEVHNPAKSFLNAENKEQAFAPFQKPEIAFLRV